LIVLFNNDGFLEMVTACCV